MGREHGRRTASPRRRTANQRVPGAAANPQVNAAGPEQTKRKEKEREEEEKRKKETDEPTVIVPTTMRVKNCPQVCYVYTIEFNDTSFSDEFQANGT